MEREEAENHAEEIWKECATTDAIASYLHKHFSQPIPSTHLHADGSLTFLGKRYVKEDKWKDIQDDISLLGKLINEKLSPRQELSEEAIYNLLMSINQSRLYSTEELIKQKLNTKDLVMLERAKQIVAKFAMPKNSGVSVKEVEEVIKEFEENYVPGNSRLGYLHRDLAKAIVQKFGQSPTVKPSLTVEQIDKILLDYGVGYDSQDLAYAIDSHKQRIVDAGNAKRRRIAEAVFKGLKEEA